MIWISLKKKEMKKIRLIKNTWYHWWINYITELIRKILGVFKDKIVRLSNTNTPKQTVYRRWNKLSKPKAQKQPEENKIRNPFKLKKKKKKEILDRIIKDRVIADIWTVFEIDEKKKERMKLKRKKKLMTD